MSPISLEQLNVPKNANTHQELQAGSSRKNNEDVPGYSVVLQSGPELQEALTGISTLQNKLEHDKEINPQDISVLQKILQQLKVKVAGQEIDLEHISKLTFLTNEAAESLSKHQGDLNLNGLTSLTDAQTESLSKHQGALYTSNKLREQIRLKQIDKFKGIEKR